MGISSPVPSMDLRRGIYGVGGPPSLGPSSAIPGLEIDPPHVEIQNGKPVYSDSIRGETDSVSEGVGGWISRMVGRGEQSDAGSVRSGQYKQLDNEED